MWYESDNQGKTTMNYNSRTAENDNLIPHCAVILVLDTSHSMWGEGLRDMMLSLKTFYHCIEAQEFSSARLDIAAVSMGDNLKMLEKFTPFRQSQLPQMVIRPKGDTPIGASLSLALSQLDTETARRSNEPAGIVTPHLVLLSDGLSTDDFSGIADEIRRRCAAGRLICRAIALGKNADLDALAQIAGENVMTPDYGRMYEAFAAVGSAVSQTYEAEAVEVLKKTLPEAPRDDSERAGHCYLLDGTNILHWDEQRRGVCFDALNMITQRFDWDGTPYEAYFDASTPYHFAKGSPQLAVYEEMLKTRPEHFQQVPAGTRADDFLLMLANRNPDAVILSQDRFRQYEEQYPWVKDSRRVAAGMFLHGMVFFPSLSLQFFVE